MLRGIAPPDQFLDRRRARDDLQRLIRDGHNILLYGERRVGKSSLLRALQAEMTDIPTLRVDCLFVSDPQDLARELLKTLSASGLAKTARFLDWAKNAARGIEVVLEVDDERVVGVLRPGTPPPRALEDVLSFVARIAAKMPRMLVVLDEFQEVMAWDDATVARIRHVAQEHGQLQWILSGSQPSVLLGLTRRREPFWQQLVEYQLGGIDIADLAQDHATRYGLPIEADAREFLAERFGDRTQQLIEVVRIARNRAKHAITRDDLEAAIEQALLDNRSQFERLLRLADTPMRRRLLLALARHPPEHVTGQDFLRDHRLGSGGGVLKALKVFQDREILGEDRRFLDPLFKEFLRRH